MTSAQKIIKYLALCLATFLIFLIISSLLGVFYSVSKILDVQKDNEVTMDKMSTVNFKIDSISSLDINLLFTNLIIKQGNNLYVETNNEKVHFDEEKNSLKIKEDSRSILSKNNKEDLILYLPENSQFKTVKIQAKAGKIQIENLVTDFLSLELGAGETSIQRLNVSENCKIESGAGKVSLLDGRIKNLDLDLGVGKFELTSSLLGSNKINAGIGSLELNLLGNKKDYLIKADKGIGTIHVDEAVVSDDSTIGTGENTIKIDGGIGNIDVSFRNKD
ncbi:hypothetical protein EGP91_01945 [bacterium]|nr:hypothetical protein [bacterium]